MGKNEQTSLELWNNIRWSNIHGSVVPEGVERGWGRGNIRQENGWKFPRSNERNQMTDSKDSKNPKENKYRYTHTHTHIHTHTPLDTPTINWNFWTRSENDPCYTEEQRELSSPNNPTRGDALSRNPVLRETIQKQRSKNLCDSIYIKFKN